MTSGKFDDLIARSLAAGDEVDLSGCVFGRKNVTPAYYRFLAGFCKSESLCDIVEIGTFQGGSTRAMREGALASAEARAEIVTFDIEKRKTEQIDGLAEITRIVGNPLALPVLRKAVARFGGRDTDLLFLDSTKLGWMVLAHFGVFSSLFNPKYVVLDDITLNPRMQMMWDMLVDRYGDAAVNIGAAYPDIRVAGELNPDQAGNPRHPGFGLVQVR